MYVLYTETHISHAIEIGKKGTCIKHLFAHTKNYYLVKRREDKKKQHTNIHTDRQTVCRRARVKKREVTTATTTKMMTTAIATATTATFHL